MLVLITGGAGFIGSHLCDRFHHEGYHVIAMDNLITGSKKNIAHLHNRERFQFIEHDVTRYIDLDKPVDAVLHFASPASPIDYLKHPIQTLKVGGLGTHNALGVAKVALSGVDYRLAKFTAGLVGIDFELQCIV